MHQFRYLGKKSIFLIEKTMQDFKNTRRHFIVDFGRFYHIFNAPVSLQVGGSKKDDAAASSVLSRAAIGTLFETFWHQTFRV